MASAAATATWMACRVVGSRPGRQLLLARRCGELPVARAAPVATRSIRLRTSAVALAVSTIASAKRRTRHVIRIPFELLLSQVRGLPERVGVRCPDRPRQQGDRVGQFGAGGGGNVGKAARVPAVASRSTVSSASNNHSARSSPLTPGHSALGLTRSSICAWTSNAVSLSRRVRIRSRRCRRSSGLPIRTVSAVVSTTIAIRARSDRMFSRRTLSGRSGIRKALQTKLHSVPTRVAPISHGSSENCARRYSEKKYDMKVTMPSARSARAEPAHVDRDEHHRRRTGCRRPPGAAPPARPR